MVQRIQAFSLTDAGKKRKNNQDTCAVFSKGNSLLMVVADGVGGNQCGEIASRLAVQTFQEEFMKGYEEAETFLSQAVVKANEKIRQYVSSNKECRGMATTLTATVVIYPNLYILHVGDSRAYLLRERALQRLTNDHTLVEKMKREGVLTDEEARVHPKRHVIVNALGISEKQSFDSGRILLKPGDKILLCSDGLYDELEESAIRDLLIENPPKEAVQELIKAANAAGGRDNISVVLASLDGKPLGDTRRIETPHEAAKPMRRFMKWGIVFLCAAVLCGSAWYWVTETRTGRRAKSYLISMLTGKNISSKKGKPRDKQTASHVATPQKAD